MPFARPLRRFAFALAPLMLVAGSAHARADDPPPLPPPAPSPPPDAITPAEPPSSTEPPATVAPPARPTAFAWKPNKSLATVGAAVFMGGYAPAVALAAPSTVGAIARVFWAVGTLGLGPLSVCVDNGSSSYWCSATHGSVQLLFPIAGPFLFAENHPRDTVLNKNGSELGAGARGLLYTSGGVQAVGGALLVASLAAGHEAPALPDDEARPGPNRPLLYSGIGMFAAGYAGAFLFSSPSLFGAFADATDSLSSRSNHCSTCSAWGAVELAVPVAGPFLFAGIQPKDEVLNPRRETLSPSARALLYADGGLQALGLVTLASSLVFAKNAPDKTISGSTHPEVRVLPLFAPGAVGASLSVASW